MPEFVAENLIDPPPSLPVDEKDYYIPKVPVLPTVKLEEEEEKKEEEETKELRSQEAVPVKVEPQKEDPLSEEKKKELEEFEAEFGTLFG